MKQFSILIGLLLLFSIRGLPVQAQTALPTDNHTAREEAEGKEIWEKLQAKEVSCENLSDEDWGALGEYYMGQMIGDSHEAMNNMMVQMMGEKSEEQMHVVMGKRLSGCGKGGGNPMMGYGGWGNMMGGWGGWGTLAALFWLVVLVDLILVGVWLWKQIRGLTNAD